MAAANFILDLHGLIWGLIEAHAPLWYSGSGPKEGKLKVATAIRGDRGRRIADPLANSAKLWADFPRLYLKATGTTGTAYDEDPSLATMADDYDPATCGGDETVTVTFDLIAVHEALRLEINSAFEVELYTALRKGGPKLGYPPVAGWRYSATRAEEQNELTGGVLREVTRATLTVRMIFASSELLT